MHVPDGGPPAYRIHPAELCVQEPALYEDSYGGGQDGRVQTSEEPVLASKHATQANGLGDTNKR